MWSQVTIRICDFSDRTALSVYSKVEEARLDLMEMFPGLFGRVYKFAQEQGWNSRTTLEEMFKRLLVGTTARSTNPERKTSLSLPVQESGLKDSK